MFKKPVKVKTQTAVRSSDKRKFQGDVVETSGLPEELVAKLLGEVTNLTVAKSAEGRLFCSGSGAASLPLFFEVDEPNKPIRVFPTVYTLWRIPQHGLPEVITHAPVLKRLMGGAGEATTSAHLQAHTSI
jgi:hypothetical protein